MQVCSPAAEALEGIRYPRVAAVTVRDVDHDDVMMMSWRLEGELAKIW